MEIKEPQNYIEYLSAINEINKELDSLIDEERENELNKLKEELNEKFLPKTYEEAVKIKELLRESINQYNEALFNETELPYSEELIDILMEEYQYYDDKLKLTEEEKLEKLDDEDKQILETGEVVKVDNVFDRLHFTFYIYAFSTLIVVLFSSILLYKIASEFMSSYLAKYYGEIYQQTLDQYALFNDPSLVMDEGKYWFMAILFFLLIPLSLLILSTICFIISRKMNKTNKTAFLIVYLLHVSIIVISSVLIFFIKYKEAVQNTYDSMPMYYFYYVYQQGASS